MLYENMSDQNRSNYKSYLSIVGSLSSLFTQSETAPYLYYRAAEKLFCDAFGAQDCSRSDIAVDATYDSYGIGLKTFLHKNGNTLQKVAEFNAVRPNYESLSDYEIIRYISGARNYRISTASALYGTNRSIYHLVTRLSDEFRIYETSMPLIDIEAISPAKIRRRKNTIGFSDGVKEYSFNLSKSTLFQRFSLQSAPPLDSFKVRVLDNPLKLLSELLEKNTMTSKILKPGVDFIYLPLYSTAPGSRYGLVRDRSGLNQWNAKGRPRNPNEVYIPVPRVIHQHFSGFLPDNNDIIFEIKLPNGESMSAKLCQQGSKGLMSNPNKALGKWLLRAVFKLNEGELATNQTLLRSGIDSVYIEKVSSRVYKIDFASLGTYESFIETYC